MIDKYTIFFSPGHPIGYEAYQKYHPSVKIMENSEILEKIKNRREAVEFVGKTEPVDTEKAISNIKEQKEDLDGLLVFGVSNSDGESTAHLPAELVQVGLPIISVERPLEGCTTIPFQAYEDDKVVTSSLPAHRDKDPEVYSRRFEDIAGKIGLIDAIAKMEDLRVLVVTDKPVLGYFEPMDIQIESTREKYEETYLNNLKEAFGTEFVTTPQEDLFEKIQKIDEDMAEETAQKWINEAMTLRGTNKSEVVKSAKLYLAMKEMMDEHNCGAITTEGFGWPPIGFQKTVKKGIPSQGMPTSQLLTDEVIAASETLTDCLLTQQLGLQITGSAGLLGDYNIDPLNNTAIICHCEGTFDPYGDERRTPYNLRNLPFVEENTGGACAEAHYPIGETVTVAKISMYKKKLSLFTGETVSGEGLFPYWNDILGRNKVAVKTDAEALFKNVDWETYGNHRTVFFGDYREEFKDLTKLIGFEVEEKDK